jgi:hypothetical protein
MQRIELSGIGRCLSARLPPQNRAGHFHGTRLPGRFMSAMRPVATTKTASGSYSPGWVVGGPFAEPCDSHLTCPRDWQPFHGLDSPLPCPKSAPFRVRHTSPIQPVMNSRCLSAAGIRFVGHLLPAMEFCLPCGRLTDQDAVTCSHLLGPYRGYYVPLQSRHEWGGCLLYSGFIGAQVNPVTDDSPIEAGTVALLP